MYCTLKDLRQSRMRVDYAFKFFKGSFSGNESACLLDDV